MTDATYTLHQTLIRLAKGLIQAWEKWLIVSSGSIKLPRPAARQMPARDADATPTQSSTRGADRYAGSTADR